MNESVDEYQQSSLQTRLYVDGLIDLPKRYHIRKSSFVVELLVLAYIIMSAEGPLVARLNILAPKPVFSSL
jgi:hypothetical protein